jgi:fructose-specific phosphotransferase system IIA component
MVMNKLIDRNLIKLDIKGRNKEDIIKELAELIDKENRLYDFNGYLQEVLNRENLSTTGIGFGIAIPHGKCKHVKIPTVAFGRIKEGVDWDSLDGKPVNMVFILAVPEESASNQHLKILAALSRKLMNENFRQEILEINNKDKLLNLLNDVFEQALEQKRSC